MTELNRSQESSILSTLRHVSELLDGISRLTAAEASPLATVSPDLSAYESRMLQALVALVEANIVAALHHLGIPVPPPRISARWSAVTALRFADVALDGLSGSSLRGYGALSEEAQAQVVAVAGDLRALLESATAILSDERRAEVDRWISVAPGAAGDVLREVRRLADEHTLPEIYPELAAVAERAGSPIVDVGVFGRISSGKSTLINALLGEPVLPVGATPMTAVPLRIQQGPARLVAHYADGRVEQLRIEDLPALATELENPHNRRGIHGLEAFVPGAPAGIRLLDTPGVAATRTTTAASAYAWLPRCDIGLVLVPVSTAVDAEDRALIRGLLAAGVESRVLLSKADLVDEAELERAVGYVRDELSETLDLTIEVHPVSATGGEGIGWVRDEVLKPLVAERNADSLGRLRRRLHHLVDTAEAAIGGKRPRSYEASIARRQSLQVAAAEVKRSTDALAMSGPTVMERAAPAVADAWRSHDSGATPLRDVVGSRLAEGLAEVREHVGVALKAIDAADQLPEAGLPPLPDTLRIADLPEPGPPALVRGPLVARTANRRLGGLEPVITDLLRSYADRLQRWAGAVLERAGDLGNGGDQAGAGPRTLESLHQRIDSIGSPDEG